MNYQHVLTHAKVKKQRDEARATAAELLAACKAAADYLSPALPIHARLSAAIARAEGGTQ